VVCVKVLTVVGARPQFIKAAPVSAALRQTQTEVLVHTGQHYDDGMSGVFFREMGIPAPDYNLGIGSGSHGRQTGEMLIRLEEVMQAEKPDRVLVYGDTNSTLAGALAACKLRIPIAHAEAGLRSFNREMPEEHNRVLTDHCADLLFCPTQTAIDNLAREGITAGVCLVGDTMHDALVQFSAVAQERSTILARLGLAPGHYLLATIHRPYNTDVPENLHAILAALAEAGEPVVFPAHPRTRARIEADPDVVPHGVSLRVIDPVGYLDMLALEQHARMLLTDSGGMQKEAYWLGVPCVTLRPETEWVETVAAGWNLLAGADHDAISHAIRHFHPPAAHPNLYGDGHAAERMVAILVTNPFDTRLGVA
jgi:UDP-GlcNAc3NAcA epimerase